MTDMRERLLVLETNEVHRRESLGRIHTALSDIKNKIERKPIEWWKVASTAVAIVAFFFALFGQYAYKDTVRTNTKAIQRHDQELGALRSTGTYNMQAIQAVGENVAKIAIKNRVPESEIKEMPAPIKMAAPKE